MQISITIYHRDTGRILRRETTDARRVEAALRDESEALVLGDFAGDLHYIDRGRAVPRPSLPQIEAEGQVLKFLASPPEGTVLRVDSPIYAEEHGITAQIIAMPVIPERALRVEIVPPFPMQSARFHLVPSEAPLPEAAQIIAPVPAHLRRHVIERVVDLVDSVAQDRGYSSAVSLASYVTSTVDAWREDATVFVAWRDAIWQAVPDMIGAIAAGAAQLDDALDALPRPNFS